MHTIQTALLVVLAAAAAAQDVSQLEQQLSAEKQQVAEAASAANHWKAMSQKQKTELDAVLKAAQSASGDESSSVGSRLISCLRTRDIIQMETLKLQQENADLTAQTEQEKGTQSSLKEEMERSIAECEARQNKTMVDAEVAYKKMQEEEAQLQSDHAKLEAKFNSAQSERDQLRNKIEKSDAEFERQVAELNKQHEAKVNKMKQARVKVEEAQRVLEKAHEVLQKRHKEVQKEIEDHRMESNKTVAQLKLLREEEAKCQEQLSNSHSKENRTSAALEFAAVRDAALKEGAKESDAKWSEVLRNVTADKNALEAKLHKIQEEAAAAEKHRVESMENLPEMQLKLRQCRAAREQAELTVQKVLEKCHKKDAFLQLQRQEWP